MTQMLARLLGFEVEASRVPYRIGFIGISDVGIEIAHNRSLREAASLASMRKRAANITTMHAMHAFLYRQHGAYAVGVAGKRLEPSQRNIYNG